MNYNARLVLKVTEQMASDVRMWAYLFGKSRAQIVREAIAEYFEKLENMDISKDIEDLPSNK
jgi:predicted DNA-binding protein